MEFCVFSSFHNNFHVEFTVLSELSVFNQHYVILFGIVCFSSVNHGTRETTKTSDTSLTKNAAAKMQ